MNRTKFLQELANVKDSYTWSIQDKKIVGIPKKGHKKPVNPLVAVANARERAKRVKLSQEPTAAAQRLGLGFNELHDIWEASDSLTNRGASQVIRGRIKKVLGL